MGSTELPMASEPSSKQKWSLIGFALLLIALSVISTLYAAGVPMAFWVSEPEPEQRYRQATMSDARAACEANARVAFGDRLLGLRVDTFSSRLDRADQQYKVFMEAQIYATEAREGVPRDTFINCFTAMDSGNIELFQYARDGEQFIAPGEERRGLFGL